MWCGLLAGSYQVTSLHSMAAKSLADILVMALIGAL